MFVTDGPITDGAETPTDRKNGAVVTFTGVVRSESNGRRVTGIYYDCYRALAEREAASIIEDVRKRFTVDAVEARHRVGEVAAGEISLLVEVRAPHRKAAFEACQAVIDGVKRRVPIWKKERYADQEAQWLSGEV
ncbi:MAG: molybdenum cofactor biosynthesis protein MoaE [Candidatus Krumholzibacteriia bacterium]